MLFGMLGSKHLGVDYSTEIGVYICLAIIVLLELNALFGKMGPLATVKGVIHSNIVLTAGLWAILAHI